MDKTDITAELDPVDVLGVRIASMLHARAYLSRVPRWTWELYQDDAKRIAAELRRAGITSDMIRATILTQAR
jgi:hypothetical protein